MSYRLEGEICGRLCPECDEPLIGLHLAPFVCDRPATHAADLNISNFTFNRIAKDAHSYFFAEDVSDAWLGPLGELIRSRFAVHGRSEVIAIKEPNGSQAADLILRAVPPPPGDTYPGPLRRVVAAHWVRPVARDQNGHIQRLGPAVLATWDPTQDAFEHFAWGVIPELADRIGRQPGDFEIEHQRRRDYLAGLAAAGVTSVDEVRTAIDGYRAAATVGVPAYSN